MSNPLTQLPDATVEDGEDRYCQSPDEAVEPMPLADVAATIAAGGTFTDADAVRLAEAFLEATT